LRRQSHRDTHHQKHGRGGQTVLRSHSITSTTFETGPSTYPQ
jgi:hypothetical protein